MAQFKVYENPNDATRQTYPYLLDIQSNLLDELRTTVVIPLSPARIAGTATLTKLCPTVEIEGEAFLAVTQQIAGIDRKHMGREVCDLAPQRAEIIAAMDFLVSGI
ncbi:MULTISPECIES: CcdB family protein [Pseudomonas]|uniref:Toxin CcdB n=1 Tax=Pseudomonas flexibilis TaxID=706570 RepID=A0A1N6WKV6_9PSED|nr:MULTISPECIES: CcdB family protein [Pseudomonas]KHL71109.1 plasmid maintenance protein CcdB [Pseudomonas flexibilis]SIQ90757.1 toxin CcdB [Pseudomonas flexibilis]